jgi:hypothetical protein
LVKLFKGYIRFIEKCGYNNQVMVWVYPSLLTDYDVFILCLWFVKLADMFVIFNYIMSMIGRCTCVKSVIVISSSLMVGIKFVFYAYYHKV